MSNRKSGHRRSRPHSQPSEDMMDLDEQMARRLQAEFGGFEGEPEIFDDPMDLDEQMARRLQEEFDAEATPEKELFATAPSTPTKPHGYHKNTHYHFIESQHGFSNSPAVPGPQFVRSGSSNDGFASYRDVANLVQKRVCPSCQTKFIGCQDDVSHLFQTWMDGQMAYVSGAEVEGKRERPETEGKTSLSTSLKWCCPRGRLFLLWAIVCGHDLQYGIEQSRANAKAANAPRKTSAGGGVGYGGGRFDFYIDDEDLLSGFDPSTLDPSHPFLPHHSFLQRRSALNPKTSQAKEQAQSAQTRSDGITKGLLASINVLLPKGAEAATRNSSNYDTDPPGAVTAIIINSKILNKIVELLRNDSLEDISKRIGVYQEAFKFLRLVGTHMRMGPEIVFREREITDDKVNLLTLSFTNNQKVKKDTAKPVVAYLKNLNVQSNIMLSGAKANPQDFQTNEAKGLISICRTIADLSQSLLSSPGARMAKEDSHSSTENMDCGILEVPDGHIMKLHHFGVKAQGLHGTAPGRMKRLITEITTLKTGLPPGIFVKFGQSRIDLMKILIVGPTGTPYDLGLFEFDLFCDGTYPNSPPQMTFRTTGGGCVSFNPNLYPNGKICLSLLGTWEGEKWNPKESTILQVLISIQAMILCDEPYCNEPGATKMSGSSHSRNYNIGIRGQTVRWGMIEWLKQPSQFWPDVVELHFKKNGAKILENVATWEREEIRSPAPPAREYGHPMLHRSHGRTNLVQTFKPHLTHLLAKYGVCEPIPGLDPQTLNAPAACNPYYHLAAFPDEVPPHLVAELPYHMAQKLTSAGVGPPPHFQPPFPPSSGRGSLSASDLPGMTSPFHLHPPVPNQPPSPWDQEQWAAAYAVGNGRGRGRGAGGGDPRGGARGGGGTDGGRGGADRGGLGRGGRGRGSGLGESDGFGGFGSYGGISRGRGRGG